MLTCSTQQRPQPKVTRFRDAASLPVRSTMLGLVFGILILAFNSSLNAWQEAFRPLSNVVSPQQLDALLNDTKVRENVVSEKVADSLLEKFRNLSPDAQQRLFEFGNQFSPDAPPGRLRQRATELRDLIDSNPELQEAVEDLRQDIESVAKSVNEPSVQSGDNRSNRDGVTGNASNRNGKGQTRSNTSPGGSGGSSTETNERRNSGNGNNQPLPNNLQGFLQDKLPLGNSGNGNSGNGNSGNGGSGNGGSDETVNQIPERLLQQIEKQLSERIQRGDFDPGRFGNWSDQMASGENRFRDTEIRNPRGGGNQANNNPGKRPDGNGKSGVPPVYPDNLASGRPSPRGSSNSQANPDTKGGVGINSPEPGSNGRPGSGPNRMPSNAPTKTESGPPQLPSPSRSGFTERHNSNTGGASDDSNELPSESVGHRFNRLLMDSLEKSMERKIEETGGNVIESNSFDRLLDRFANSIEKTSGGSQWSQPNTNFLNNLSKSVNNSRIGRSGAGGIGNLDLPNTPGMDLPSVSPGSLMAFLIVGGGIAALVVVLLRQGKVREILGLTPLPDAKPRTPPNVDRPLQDYHEIVQSIDRTTLWMFGNQSEWWNSRKVQTELAANHPELKREIESTLRLYDLARYTKAQSSLASSDLTTVQSTLKKLVRPSSQTPPAE